MGRTARQIAELNQRTLDAIASGAEGIDWLSHPFVGFHTIALPNAEPFVMFSNNDCHIVRELIWRRGFEDFALRLWVDRAKICGTVFDIGANTGLYSLAAAAANAEASIVAFEPLPEALKRLELNVQVNDFQSVRTSQFAVANAPATVALEFNKKAYRLINTGGRVRSTSSAQSPNIGRITARTIKFDEVLDQMKVVGRMLVKIDVEGGEEAVLVGGETILQQHCPDIFLEILDPEKVENLLAYLRPRGYRFFRILETSEQIVSEEISASLAYNYGDWNWFATVDLDFSPSRYNGAEGG
jgi:FkbM family methyltransferase